MDPRSERRFHPPVARSRRSKLPTSERELPPCAVANTALCDRTGATRMSPSITSSPVMSALPEPRAPARVSPIPVSTARPGSSRARKNSLQSNVDSGKAKAPMPAPIKANGMSPATPDLPVTSAIPRPGVESRPLKESNASVKPDSTKTEEDRADGGSASATGITRKEGKADEPERKSESLPPQAQAVATVTTKSGRASKPSTPALANAQEPARPRSSRNADNGGGSKKSQKKSNPTLPPLAPHAANAATNGRRPADDEEGEIDADEPTYCYCNGVSYGEMVACDADGCEREWFHLACVGLKVAPGSRSEYPWSLSRTMMCVPS